ncbi:MAG: hypothetical protein U5K70_04360 [Halodesulfurarchaeum sp.]|nr:hypothetical protein [Halodesulfurarchaeum sp.]
MPTLPDDDPRLDNMDDSETVETEDGDQAIIGDEWFTGNDDSDLFDTDGDGEPNVPEELPTSTEDVEQAREEIVTFLENPGDGAGNLSRPTVWLIAAGVIGGGALAVNQGGCDGSRGRPDR